MRVISEAQTQEFAEPCSRGNSRVWSAHGHFRAGVFRGLGAGWPRVLLRGQDRRHFYHQQQWQFVTQPFCQISVEDQYGLPLIGLSRRPSSGEDDVQSSSHGSDLVTVQRYQMWWVSLLSLAH